MDFQLGQPGFLPDTASPAFALTFLHGRGLKKYFRSASVLPPPHTLTRHLLLFPATTREAAGPDVFQESCPGDGQLPWQALELAASLTASANSRICHMGDFPKQIFHLL